MDTLKALKALGTSRVRAQLCPELCLSLSDRLSFSLSIRKLISTFELSVCTQISMKPVICALLETLNLLFLTTPNFPLCPHVFPFFPFFSQKLM